MSDINEGDIIIKEEGGVRSKFDEGNLVTEYLILFLSLMLTPFIFISGILHAINYFKIKNANDGIRSHFKYISKTIMLFCLMFVSIILYLKFFMSPEDIQNIESFHVQVILWYIIIFSSYLICRVVKGLKCLARRELI